MACGHAIGGSGVWLLKAIDGYVAWVAFVVHSEHERHARGAPSSGGAAAGGALAPVLQLIRGDERRIRAAATLETVRERMRGTAGIDEELSALHEGGRG